MKRIEDIKTMDNQGPGGHVRFGRVRRKHGFGLATVGLLAVASLVASACSSSSDSAESAPSNVAPPAVTEPADITSTTAVSDVPVLPATVPEAVEEAPTFPIPVPPAPTVPTTTVSPDVFIPGTTLPPNVIEPLPGVSGYEFTASGGNGNTFFVKLGATHPPAVCFSFTEGDPRLSGLQAGTIAEAETEIADIGSRCVDAVSGQEFEVDTTDAAVGCVLDTGEVADVCGNTGLPDFPTTTTETPDNPTQTPPATTIPPTTTTVPPQPVSDKPSLAGLTPEEVVITRLELFQTYPLPVEDAGIGGFPTDEDFRTWETVVYSQLLAISKVGTNISPDVGNVNVDSTDLPEFLDLLL